MPRYIDIEPIEKAAHDYGFFIVSLALINEQPTADVVERKVGEWIWDDEMGVFLCSSCKNGWKDQPTLMGKPLFEWCPVCGAEMSERREYVGKSNNNDN